MPKPTGRPQRVTVLNPDGGPARMTVTPRRRGRRTVNDVWIEQALAGTSAGWILASRVIVDDRGLPVIAEIRVFPDEPKRWVSDPLIGRVPLDPGEWSAKALGWDARRSVPRGGLPATLIRRGLPLAEHVDHARRTFTLVAESRTRQGTTSTLDDTFAALEAAGYPLLPVPAVATGTKTRRGRPPLWSAGDCARVALVYDTALTAKTSPIKAVAAAEGITDANAKNLVAKARKLGQLPVVGRSGRKPHGLIPRERETLRRQATKRRRQRGR